MFVARFSQFIWAVLVITDLWGLNVEADIFVEDAVMRHLAPLNLLNEGSYKRVVESARSFSLPPGASIKSKFEEQWFIYLVSGKLLLLNRLNETYGVLEARSAAAESPVFGHGQDGNAQAKTHVEFLRVDKMLYEILVARQTQEATEVAEISFDEDDAEIFASLYDAFESNQLKVPSLPEVLVAVNKAIADPDMGFVEIAAIIQKDPPYTAKLLQLANSPAYQGAGQTSTLSFAISRIGVEAVRSLITAVAVSEMVENVHPSAVEPLRLFYQEAAEIAALCFVLARRIGTIPEERALMAGLLHRLGMVPIVSHASDVLQPTPEPARIRAVAGRLIEPVSGWLLSEWGLDGELCDVAESATDYYRPCDKHLGIMEVVIAARLLCLAEQGVESEVNLADTPIGARLIAEGVDISDTSAFLMEIAEELEAARALL